MVLGMHRSGTSAVARILNLLGAALPKNIMGANLGNDSGHWEPKKLVDFHDQILAEFGSDWSDWQSFDLTRIPYARRQALAAEIVALLNAEYADAQLMLVKDPRLCRFAPFFIETLANETIETCVILPIRNPLEVTASLMQRDGMLQADAALLWLRHILDAEATTRKLPRAFVTYAGLLADWKQSVRRVTECLAIDWPNSIEDIDDQVTNYLSSAHRHHAHSAIDIIQDPMMRGWIADAYDALLELVSNPASKTAMVDLDRIRSEFDRATPIIHHHSSQVRRRGEQKIEMLATQLAERDERLKDNAAKLSLITHQLAEAETEIHDMKTSVSWKLTAPLRGLIQGVAHIARAAYLALPFDTGTKVRHHQFLLRHFPRLLRDSGGTIPDPSQLPAEHLPPHINKDE